jgi:hypothetical protein
MTQTVVLTQPVRVGGSVLAAGTTQAFARDVAADLVARGSAIPVGIPGWQSDSEQASEITQFRYKRDFQTKKFNVLDDMGSAATAWNNNKSGCTIEDSGEIVREQNGLLNALKVKVTASYVRFQRTITPVTMTGTINLWVYFDEDPTFGSNLEFYATSDNANWATKYIKYAWSSNSYLRRGWNCLSLHTGEDTTTTSATITSAGGVTLGDAINGLKIIANSLTSGAVFRIGGIFWGGTARPNVLMNLDDGYSSQWDIFNIFRARQIPLSLSIITSKVGRAGYLTWDQLDTMYDWGCDLIPHSVSHPLGGLDALSESAAKDELERSRKALLSHGYSRTADIFAWPQNDYVSSVGVDLITLASSVGYKMCRGSTRMDLPTAQGIDNPMRLPSADIGSKTLSSVLKLLDAAELYKQTNILYAHKLVGTATSPSSGGAAPADPLEWYWSDFIALADSIADRYTAGTLTPITYSDLKAECRY